MIFSEQWVSWNTWDLICTIHDHSHWGRCIGLYLRCLQGRHGILSQLFSIGYTWEMCGRCSLYFVWNHLDQLSILNKCISFLFEDHISFFSEFVHRNGLCHTSKWVVLEPPARLRTILGGSRTWWGLTIRSYRKRVLWQYQWDRNFRKVRKSAKSNTGRPNSIQQLEGLIDVDTKINLYHYYSISIYQSFKLLDLIVINSHHRHRHFHSFPMTNYLGCLLA